METALIQKQLLEALENGNSALKELQNEMKIEDVEKLMDDTREGIAYQEVCKGVYLLTRNIQEIDQILSEKISQDDEEEILRQLDSLIEQELALPEVPKSQATAEQEMPNVPDTKLPTEASTQKKVELENQEEPLLA